MKFYVLFFTFAWLIRRSISQYPDATLTWDFMTINPAANTDIIAGQVLDLGGTNGALNGKAAWLDPTDSGLGWMFEGYNIACGGPDARLNFGDTFGFHTWIYFTDLATTQTIWCKEWLETEGDPELNSLRLCLYLIDGQFVVLWNPADVNTHLTNYLLTDPYNYQYQKLGVFAKFGWTYLAVNFKTDPYTQKASIWAYMANHDQCKTVSETFLLDGPIVDDDKFIF